MLPSAMNGDRWKQASSRRLQWQRGLKEDFPPLTVNRKWYWRQRGCLLMCVIYVNYFYAGRSQWIHNLYWCHQEYHPSRQCHRCQIFWRHSKGVLGKSKCYHCFFLIFSFVLWSYNVITSFLLSFPSLKFPIYPFLIFLSVFVCVCIYKHTHTYEMPLIFFIIYSKSIVSFYTFRAF